MVYKSLNGLALDYLKSMFTDRSSTSTYSLRNCEGKRGALTIYTIHPRVEILGVNIPGELLYGTDRDARWKLEFNP